MSYQLKNLLIHLIGVLLSTADILSLLLRYSPEFGPREPLLLFLKSWFRFCFHLFSKI